MRAPAFAVPASARQALLDRSIHGPSAYAEAALEPLRSIRLQFMLRLRGARSRIARDIRPAAAPAAQL